MCMAHDDKRYSTDDGHEEEILDAENAAKERSDWDDEREAKEREPKWFDPIFAAMPKDDGPPPF